MAEQGLLPLVVRPRVEAGASVEMRPVRPAVGPQAGVGPEAGAGTFAKVDAELLEQARAHIEAGTSGRTRALYTDNWKRFLDWCAQYGAPPLPARPEIVVLYMSDLARRGKAASTIELSLVAINKAHQGQGFASPTTDVLVREARKDWLKCAAIERGPVFRRVHRSGKVGGEPMTPKSVALVVKRAAEAAGMDASRYSGHSLRAGLATEAAKAYVFAAPRLDT